MSPWFQWRRLAAGGGRPRVDSPTDEPPVEAAAGDERREPGAEVTGPEGDISPGRLDQALRRLRDEIPRSEEPRPPEAG